MPDLSNAKDYIESSVPLNDQNSFFLPIYTCTILLVIVICVQSIKLFADFLVLVSDVFVLSLSKLIGIAVVNFEP